MIDWRKILFKLHLTNSYPSFMTGLAGSKVPCNIIRTDDKSHSIRPDFAGFKHGFLTIGQDPKLVNSSVVIHDFNGNEVTVYTPAPDVKDGTLSPIKRAK